MPVSAFLSIADEFIHLCLLFFESRIFSLLLHAGQIDGVSAHDSRREASSQDNFYDSLLDF